MKAVSDGFKDAQALEYAKSHTRIYFKLRTWNSGSSSYQWDASWTELDKNLIVSVVQITAKLDTYRLNEFKISNVDLTILNANDSWDPWGGSIFTGKEPYWTKFKIETGSTLS